MLLTITTKYQPATDMGFLLHKNPNKLHTLSTSFGKVHVFYPEATKERCTVALLLDIDPIGLVRRNRGNFALAQYVNDRPYVASSFMSVALNKAFRSLLSGKSKERQELVNTSIPWEINMHVIPCEGGISLLEKLFHPLNYELKVQKHMLDNFFLDWGESQYYSLMLKRTCPLKEFLSHLYVLIPVLDNEKHYYISDNEIEKLFRFGEGWLDRHPESAMITKRYLQFSSISNAALARLEEERSVPTRNDQSEHKMSLHEQRVSSVIETLRVHKAKRVIDIGCGEGNLLQALFDDSYFEYIAGCDVSSQALDRARRNLGMDSLSPMQVSRISLFQTALTYRDKRLDGYDAATITEVIEHLDLPKLDIFRRVVFEFARPRTVIITTPNSEYNVLYENLLDDVFRHVDHRFEWTRKEFEQWSKKAASEFAYSVDFLSIGEKDATYGTPTQMGVFLRNQ